MNKKEFRDLISIHADDLYARGFKDGANSVSKVKLITVEDEDGITFAFKFGTAEHARVVDIPQALLDKIAEGVG